MVDTVQFWLTNLFRWFDTQFDTPIVASAFFFGGIPSLIVGVYVIIRWEYINIPYIFGIVSLLIVTSVAPYLIRYYDTRLFPKFCEDIHPLLEEPSMVDAVGQRYHSLLATWWWLPVIIASLPIPPLLYFGEEFFRQYGLFGSSDPLFLVVTALLFWISTLVGIGFFLVAISVLVIHEIATELIEIDPMHPDGQGGMSAVSQYAIRTTTLFSFGSLLFPIQLQYATTVGSTATSIIYSMTILYSAFIAGSFLYPIILINRRADSIRERNLEKIQAQYYTLKTMSNEPTVGANVITTDPAVEEKLNRLQQEYREHRDVQLFPLQLSVLIRLFTSTIFPILLIFVEQIIQTVI